MSATNGAVPRVKLTVGEGWFLLEKGGRTFLGPLYEELGGEPENEESEVPGERPEGYPTEFTLAPCYEVRRALGKDPRSGKDGVMVLAEPYFYFSEIMTPVTICSPDLITDLADVQEADRGIFVHCVKMAEESRLQSRAARSGLVTPAARG